MTNKLGILFSLVIFLYIQKIVAVNFTNFNLFGDEAQYWLWSMDLDYGYFSKPPFLSWVIAGYSIFFGDSFFSLKLLPPLIYLFTGWAVFNLCKNIGLEKNNSLRCSLIFLFIPAVSFSSFIISTDILLLLFWTLSLNELVKIKKKQNKKSFIMLGVFVGLAFLSKYAAIYFIVCLLIYILFDKDFKALFVKSLLGFVISFLCILVIILPNIMWNINNEWLTLKHTSDNANFENIDINIFRGIGFISIQILMLGPFLFIGSIINYKNIILDDRIKLLLFFSLPIFFIVFIEAVIVRANGNWAAPGLVSFFILLYLTINNNFFKKINLIYNFIFCLIFFMLIGVSYQTKIFNRINGINDFAKSVYLLRSDENITAVVISDRLLFASMKYEMKDRNINFFMPHQIGNKITNHFKITSSLKKGMKENFILIGSPNEITYLENKFELEKLITPKYKFTKKKIEVYEIIFN